MSKPDSLSRSALDAGYFVHYSVARYGNGMSDTSKSRGFVTPAVARIIPFALFIAFIALQSIGDERLRSVGVNPQWLYPARTVMVAIALLALWRHYSELHDLAGTSLKWIAAAFVAGMAVFFLWINLEFDWATVGKPSAGFDPTQVDGTIDWVLVGFRMIGLAVVVPIMEELLWRSFLLRWIDQQDFLNYDPIKVSLRALLIGSVLFASEHSLWFAGLLAGLVYSFIYMRSRNLWVPIICHATTNGALGWWILATGQWQFW